MTGFGRATVTDADRQFTVEVRSVNHRNLDVKIRGRHLQAGAEAEIHRTIRGRLGRGSVQVTVDEESDGQYQDDGLLVRARRMYGELDKLRQQLGVVPPIDLDTVAAFLRLDKAPSNLTVAWESIRPAVQAALSDLVKMRQLEGKALQADLAARARHLREVVDGLAQHVAPLAERASGRLLQRLNQVLNRASPTEVVSVDASRLAQEAAMLADRLDVSEELARLNAHVATLTGWIQEENGRPEGFGRALEFLLQEIARELNTLGAKAQDTNVSMLVVGGRAELEKIREQAQNIE